MPRPRVAMRKIRDVLRLSFSEGLSRRQVSLSLGIPFTTVSGHVKRAKAAGLSWPLPDDLDDDALETLLFRAAAPAVGDPRDCRRVRRARCDRIAVAMLMLDHGNRSMIRANAP